ncbi:MAG: kelch repeat-containing protein [Crocinitomicaceae bacterium]
MKAPYPALGRDDGIAFSLQSFGYCVTGNTGNFAQSNSLYQYDPRSNLWIKKSSFPSEARQYSTVFTIENKAYIIGGYSKSGNGLAEVWCYDAASDSWTQKNNFTGGIRWGAIGFTIAGMGYFGCGTDADTVYNDFWEYEPLTDKWNQLENLIGEPRREAVACSAAGFGMAGTGFKTFTTEGFLNDWYTFDPKLKQWAKAPNYPGGNIAWGKAESNGHSAIVGSGMDENQIFKSDFYQFNILSRTWQKLQNIPVGPVRGCSSFRLDNSVYFVTGLTELYERSKALTALKFEPNDFSVNLFPNPSSGCFHFSSNSGQSNTTIKVYNMAGELIEKRQSKSDLLNFTHLKSGLYLLEFTNESGDSDLKKVIIL